MVVEASAAWHCGYRQCGPQGHGSESLPLEQRFRSCDVSPLRLVNDRAALPLRGAVFLRLELLST